MKISIDLLKKLIVPISVLGCLVLLIIFGGQFLLGRVGSLRSDLTSVRMEESKLKTKLNRLNDFELTGQSTAQSVSVAVPQDNPSVLAISQIRDLAGTSGLFVSRLTAGKSVSGDALSYVDIDFDAEGSVNDIINFLTQLKKSAPFGTINKVTLGGSGGALSSTVTYRVYFLAVPASIPPVDDEIPEFDNDDNDIINMLSSLTPPNFVELTPQSPVQNSNPFGL